MRSPYGRRGSLCANLNFSWNFLHHGISYAKVLRIAADMPRVEHGKEEGKPKPQELTCDAARALISAINQK